MENRQEYYYLVPLEDITDEMVMESKQTSRDTIRKSIRPISGKIHGILAFRGEKPPSYMSKYKAYTAFEVREKVQTPDWNITQTIWSLMDRYDFNRIKADFDNGRIIQSYGELYITVFQILKFKFFTHHLSYLDSPEKWNLFIKGSRFEKANEYTMLELNFFYNLISQSELEIIDKFRNIRNDIAHSFDISFSREEMIIMMNSIDELISKYFMELSV